MYNMPNSKMHIVIAIAVIYTACVCAYMMSDRSWITSSSSALEAGPEAYKDLEISNVESHILAKKTQIEKKTERSLEESQDLAIRLVGILATGKEKIACIEDLMSSRTGEYKIGDNIMGATLVQIHSSEVLLVKDGERIILRLSDGYQWSDPDDWITRVSNNSFVVSRKRLGEQLKSINELLGELVPVVSIKDGKIEGFRIASLKKDGFINTAGFKKDDVIKRVNGLKIDSLRKPIELYRGLRELVKNYDTPVCIELERDNEIHSLSYRILRD